MARGVRRARLDAELVRRGLARSREHASELVGAGKVKVGGVVATKPATGVGADAAIVVDTKEGDDPQWASRGAYKLLGALEAFAPQGLLVENRSCLDAGASTGGFTDVLLRHGARQVIAVDVGYGQLVWGLRTDDRVTVLDRTNVRTLTLDAIGGEQVDLTVGDLSFISLRIVLPALSAVTRDDLVLMVKPQFEVGKERLGKGGVVREPELRASAVREVAKAAYDQGWGTKGVTASPLPGPSGNVEYFLWMNRAAPSLDETMLATAIESGPQ